MMKISIGKILSALGISLFTGVIIISIGLGAAIPALHRIAAPFVCSGGSMQKDQHTYFYRPGESSTTLNWYCIKDGAEEGEDITFLVALVAGVEYGLILFAIYLILNFVLPLFGIQPINIPIQTRSSYNSNKEAAVISMRSRLEKLRELYEANLITTEEYEEKKHEILTEI